MRGMNSFGCVVLALALVTAAGSGAPPLEIRWSINDGTVNTVLPDGVDLGGGAYAYDGQATDAATGLKLDFAFTGHALRGLEGNVNLVNEHNRSIRVSVDVVFPLDVVVHDASELRGFGVVGLTTGIGGGAVSSVPPWLWQTLVDEHPVGNQASLFFHPFEMTISGPGSAAAFADYGQPEPVGGPPIMESVGFRIQFGLTEIDAASVSSEMILLSCPADLDGSGGVGANDLAMLIAQWGPCPPPTCDANLDGEGGVGTEDLLLLLASWGGCPAF